MAHVEDCVTRRRVCRTEFKWTLEDLLTWCDEWKLPIRSAAFHDDGLHGTSWTLELSTHAGPEYTPQYGDGGAEIRFALQPSSEISPRLAVKCSISFLAPGGDVVSGWHALIRGENKGQSYRHSFRLDRIKAQRACWLPDGHLRILCRVQISDFVHVTVRATHDGSSRPTSREVSESLADDLGRLLTDGRLFSDVTLLVGERRFAAHKALLAARSPVFRAMFQANTKEGQSGHVDVVGVDHDVFQRMLAFIYTGRAGDIGAVAADLLAAADRYQLDQLKEICEVELVRQLSATNAAQSLMLADIYSLAQLKQRTIRFINLNVSDVCATADWKEMTAFHPHLVAEVYTGFMVMFQSLNQ